MENKIPKVIHYCWFGKNPLPELAIKCIESWKKYCPDYEIKEWNEDNFDINCCAYVKEAYEAKKWAFVSDYARFWILYNYGGVYFDTDVELLKPIDEIIENGSFMAMEKSGSKNNKKVYVAPGLGIGSGKQDEIYKELLDLYNSLKFNLENNKYDETTVVVRTSNLLEKYGFIREDKKQKIKDIVIYPTEFFCPINYETGIEQYTDNTYSVHHYSGSWLSEKDRKILAKRKKLVKLLGESNSERIMNIY